jgi:hypothetical protein
MKTLTQGNIYLCHFIFIVVEPCCDSAEVTASVAPRYNILVQADKKKTETQLEFRQGALSDFASKFCL